MSLGVNMGQKERISFDQEELVWRNHVTSGSELYTIL